MPLGMEDQRILSGHLRASSSYNYKHGPDRARLNLYASHGRTGAWVARHRNTNQWLQIDLRQMSVIKGIATQGRRGAHQWVRTFQLSHSRYGAQFQSYVSYGRVKVSLKLRSFDISCATTLYIQCPLCISYKSVPFEDFCDSLCSLEVRMYLSCKNNGFVY